MSEIPRIDATQAYLKSRDGDALLVCAYDDQQKCEESRLAGSVTLQEFKNMKSAIPKDQEIVFYCA